ncbi:MAG: serine/threonine protein kinase, partial [Clostridia bacterium]|nr:serine/threonine protein kinase [Clostridia bacterium]
GVRSAIKVSLDSIDEQNPAVKKELENLKLVKALTGHPHIVSLLDYWVVSGYLVTRWELATDGTLLDMLERYRQDGQPGLPLKPLIRWIYEAADGLDFLHEKGIYHRDIKPQNLLVFHGHVKLGDLGLAKLVGASTASHTGSGTFGYLPPEAWGDRRLTPSVDLYCLAATYIKLRTGQEPFGTNPVEIVERQKKGEPILDGLEDWEKPLLLAALDPDPGKRFSRGARAWVRKLSTAWQKSASSSQPTDASLRRVAASFTPLQAQTQHEQASRLVPHAAPSNAATESTQKLPEVSTTARPLPRRQRYFAGVLASCVFLFLVLLVGIWILGQRPDVKVGQGDTTTTHIPNGTARPDIEVGQADTTAAQTTSDSASRPETKPGQGDTTTTQTANGTTAPSHLIVGQPDVPTLEAAIERCPPAGTIRLPAGVYRLTTPLEITKP